YFEARRRGMSQWASLKHVDLRGTRKKHVPKYAEYLQRSRVWSDVEDELARLGETLQMYPYREQKLLRPLSTDDNRVGWIKIGEVLWEVRGTIDGTWSLVGKGQFAATYRELRRILEDVLWAVVHDTLLVGSSREHLEVLEHRLPFMAPSPTWFRLSKEYKAHQLPKLQEYGSRLPDSHRSVAEGSDGEAEAEGGGESAS
ncbi:MAG: hypothetical protein ACP5LG_07460, partial [Conexivisphaera sp.]